MLLKMLVNGAISEPFNKLPPDGPLQKGIFKISKENCIKNQSKNSNENPSLSIEELQKELKKSHEREKFLRDELMVNNK